MSTDLKQWLTQTCAGYGFPVRGLFQAEGHGQTWPLHAANAGELAEKLNEGGHLLPLPREPAALANVLEVSIVDYLVSAADAIAGCAVQRGTERGYPDLELSGAVFGGGFHAIDIKVARRRMSKKTGLAVAQTQSRITLYTGNTYFRYPTLHWPGTFRPFADYTSHLDVLGIYTLDPQSNVRVVDLELIVQEPWRIGSRQRSSTTREYLGAVQDVQALREGRGEFDTEAEFYAYWRRYRFKIGDVVQKQLDRLLAGGQQPPGVLQPPLDGLEGT